MYNIQPIRTKVLRQFENLELDGNLPVYKFHSNEIYKLKVDGQISNTKNGEIAFLAQNSINLEKCIIYITMKNAVEIQEIKYWRSINMDNEICSYLVQDFILNYLSEKYSIISDINSKR